MLENAKQEVHTYTAFEQESSNSDWSPSIINKCITAKTVTCSCPRDHMSLEDFVL